MESEEHTIGRLLFCARERLLGEVIPSLRGVAVEWNGDCIVLYFYHDGPLNEEIRDHYACIGTEIVADFSKATIDDKIISLKHPIPLPPHEHWAYRRKEPFVDPR